MSPGRGAVQRAGCGRVGSARAYCGHVPGALPPVSRRTPLVGVTTYAGTASWGPWDRAAAVVPATYVEAVAVTGARPVLLPPSRAADVASDGAADVVDALDALVLVGGGDVDPSAYGRPAHRETSGVDPVRDASERALLAAALAADLPVLAVCRGLQLLNVHLGGTLFQHLPDIVGHHGHQPASGRFSDVEVVTVPGSRMAELLGGKATVACSHHQSVERVGKGLVVTARSSEPVAAAVEAVVEAVELPGHRFVVGVQWHPEENGDRRLFDALVAAVR